VKREPIQIDYDAIGARPKLPTLAELRRMVKKLEERPHTEVSNSWIFIKLPDNRVTKSLPGGRLPGGCRAPKDPVIKFTGISTQVALDIMTNASCGD
jgi:hypothetical protein